ncbi:MAG: glycosyltransferase family 2 protein [Clostridia bacterium]|nr:glycosyltransferase family 2 protein [Clostridia bacterium]
MTRTDPLISVIIPVYRVEEYLKRCVDSITGQHYENLEIILVDDGSPDRCGEICDKYQKLDGRIKVIHKENGGQSSARNAALDIAKGEYITFADSDDAADPDMISYLYEAIRKSGSQIAICGFCKITGSRSENENPFRQDTVLDGEDIINAIITDEKIGSQPCGKLFSASLFEGIRFPVGMVYEDIAIMHLVFAKANRIICLKGCKYRYYIREDSTSFSVNNRWHYGLFRAFADRYMFAVQNNLTDRTRDVCLSKASYFAVCGLRYWKPNDSEACGCIKESRNFLRRNMGKILSSKRISAKNKTKIISAVYAYRIYKSVYH